MKRIIGYAVVALTAASLLSGCIGIQLGGGSKTETSKTTKGEQLVDLKKAKDAGALTDAEYEAQKTKILNEK